ncbi:hypothetical protein B0H13DRAFT_2306288 [Mycena leptocephala]|nr:hypothetical protein B0H13DRAFT_2306288 [Mycena leptocephala]
MDPPSRLSLSALTWSGFPVKVTPDDDDRYVGSYDETLNVLLAKLRVDNAAGIVEYVPVKRTRLVYTRESYAGPWSSDPGEILDEAFSPIMRIRLPGKNAWPESFSPNETLEFPRPAQGPPFLFFASDLAGENGLSPYMVGNGIAIVEPDLPGHTSVLDGWVGPWVTRLLEKYDRGDVLDGENKVIWNYGPKAWGVQVRLRIVNLSENLQMPDEPLKGYERALSGYTICATIMRVFVVRSKLTRILDGGEPEDDLASEAEDEGMGAHLKANSTFTLAQARYGRDFVPTREATKGSASIYTFKSTRDYLNYDPVSETKNRSHKYLSTVFGAVGNVVDAGDGVHLVIRMKCPVDISCDAQAMYFKQIRRMKTIIEKDGKSTPGGVNLSWLDRTSRDGPSGHQKYGRYFVVIRANSASEFEAAKNLFWASEIAGKIVRLVVSMERRDTIDCTASVKSYTMFVTRYEVQADNCLPRIDADYRCDFAELNCRFCEKRRRELAL